MFSGSICIRFILPIWIICKVVSGFVTGWSSVLCPSISICPLYFGPLLGKGILNYNRFVSLLSWCILVFIICMVFIGISYYLGFFVCVYNFLNSLILIKNIFPLPSGLGLTITNGNELSLSHLGIYSIIIWDNKFWITYFRFDNARHLHPV